MPRPGLVIALIGSLLTLSTRAGAMCLACANCDYETTNPPSSAACLNYWTCSGNTLTCYYPSLANPGTYNGCEFTVNGYDYTFTSGPSFCDPYIGDNSKCEPPNDPWNPLTSSCTASYGYVGET